MVSDTLFKLSPKLSSQLSQSEKAFVKNGTEFEVISYTEAEGNHTRLVLANQTLGNNQRTWYAYNPDIEIESSPVKLRVVSDTLFKERPVLSSQLADDEKVFVKNKTEFDLQSYLPAAGNHIKVALANKFLGPQNRNTWYAYEPDVQISGSVIKLKVVSDTLFKLRPVLSSQLSASEKIFVKNGTEFELTESQLAEGNHVRVVLASTGLGDRNLKEWYAYAPDIVVEGNQSDNTPHQGGGATLPLPVPTPKPPVTNKPTGSFPTPRL